MVDSEKVAYCSDFTDLEGPFGLALVLYAKIGDEDKHRIFGLNVEKILNE